MTIEEYLAREEIHVLFAAYTEAGDRGRLPALAACFAPDGVLEFPGTRAAGPEQITTALGAGPHNPALTLVRHHIALPRITLEATDQASARTYFTVFTNAGLDHTGHYADRLVRLPQGWRFALRQVRIDWQAKTSLHPDFGTRK